MKPFDEMTMDELHERLGECREFQRVLRIQYESLGDQIMGIGFQCDDILDAIRERRVPLRVVGGCGV